MQENASFPQKELGRLGENHCFCGGEFAGSRLQGYRWMHQRGFVVSKETILNNINI